MAAGAMVSSTADLAHFYQALLGGRLLDPEQLQAMHTTVDASDQLEHGAGHGLGLMVLRPGCATELWGHGGALAGYRTTAFSTKDANRQLVTTTNLNPEPNPGAAQAAVDNLLRRQVSCQPSTPHGLEPATATSAVLSPSPCHIGRSIADRGSSPS